MLRRVMSTEDTRERLLNKAMEIFSAQGYVGASTRDICRAAEVGNAAIHYHFGDKAAIYRELFKRLLDNFEQRLRSTGMQALQGRTALAAYYRELMRPLVEDDSLAQQVYLHIREEFQPSAIVDDLKPRALKLQFELLGGLLQRELAISDLDAAAQRLVLALHGIALIYVIQHRSIGAMLPQLMDGPNWLGRTTEQLADLGWAMIESERAKRVEAGH